ncbi:MAG: hypothetical protein ACI9NT_002672 [Bacteroidia bacterium]|jgi:hypothetical protein
MMFKKKILVAGISMALSAKAYADYRFEVDGTAGGTNFDNGKGPLGKAVFLDLDALPLIYEGS